MNMQWINCLDVKAVTLRSVCFFKNDFKSFTELIFFTRQSAALCLILHAHENAIAI